MSRPDSGVSPDPTTDRVDAVTFTHPALPGRSVVRLVPAALARGESTRLGLAGFTATTRTEGVTHQPRRALGFPDQALLLDPANARFALDVMKEFVAARKRIATKPGHARDAFQVVATDLGRKAPHFLPSFWEEAGRAFLAGGNLAMAATAFEKARAAEREHGLPVDADTRADVFLEFALAGALNVKSLQAWATELRRLEGPAVALARFSDLCVRRTLGGLAPWASLARDLRELAKAAGANTTEVEESFLRAVLAAPAVRKAPLAFWRDLSGAATRIAATPAGASALAHIFPSNLDDDGLAAWLGLLGTWGVVASIAAHGVGGGGRGTAAWFGRVLEVFDDCPLPVLGLAITLADRLRVEGAPVPVFGEDVWRAETLDAMDELLARGVALQVTDHQNGHFNLEGWADQEGARRDPVHVAAHPELGPILARSVVRDMDEAAFQRVAPGKSAFREARHAHLRETVAALLEGALPGAEEAIERLEGIAGGGALTEFPDVAAALAEAGIAEPLTRSLRGGVLDELGWPAFDTAWAELAGVKKADVEVATIAPWCVLHDNRRAIVIGPAGREAEVDLKLPKGREPAGFRWTGGQLLVAWRDADDWSVVKGKWSGRPREELTLAFELGWRSADAATPPWRATGLALCGARLLRPGDTAVDTSDVWSDAEGVWTEHDDAFYAVDPETGKRLDQDTPAFFAERDGVLPGHGARAYHPQPVADSPLGGAHGQYGWARFDLTSLDVEAARAWRAKHVTHPTVCCTGDDPREVALDADGRSLVASFEARAFVTFPGDTVPRILGEHDSADAAIYDAEGRAVALVEDGDSSYRAGTPSPLAQSLWHHLRPRDAAASGALRGATAELAGRLLTATAALTVDELDDAEGWDAAAPILAPLLPVTDPVLRRGMAGVVCRATALQARLDALRSSSVAGATTNSDTGDDALVESISGLASGYYEDLSVVAAIRAAAQWLAGAPAGGPTPESTDLPRSDLPWWDWLTTPGALVFLALSPATTPTERGHILPVVDALANGRFAADPPVRRLRVTAERAAPWLRWVKEYGDTSLAAAWGFVVDGVRYVAASVDSPDEGPVTVDLLQAPAGALPPQSHLVTESTVRIDGPPLAALFAAQTGELPVGDDVYTAISGPSGLSRPEAAALWAGMRQLKSWESEPLGKPAREKLGLKVTEARLARDTLSGVPAEKRARVFHAAVLGLTDLADLPARLGAAWVAVVGKRAPIDPALLAESRKDFPGGDGPEALVALADVGSAADWQNDATYTLDGDGDVVRTGTNDDEEAPGCFDEEALRKALGTLVWVYSHTPSGDPLRARLPELADAVTARLRHPGLLVNVISGEGKAFNAYFKRFEGAPLPLPVGEEPPDHPPVARTHEGVIVVKQDDTIKVTVRPGAVDDATLASLAPLAALEDNWTGAEALAGLRLAGSAGLRGIVARVRGELGIAASGTGAWDQDPRVSAPDVVAAATSALSVSANAAVLYLQLLTLPDPTRANVLRWNGWKPTAYTAAVAELVEQKLVVEAKRARAGRDHFLPGGWHEQRSGSLPLEEWKLPLYGGAEPPLGSFVALEPLGDLFRRAWSRFQAGDTPRYEKIASKVGKVKP